MSRSAQARDKGFLQKLKDFLVGATVYSAIKDLEEKRLLVEYGLMLSVFGDMLGFPACPYYRLRLLPLWLPRIKSWKHYLLKEKDITEKL